MEIDRFTIDRLITILNISRQAVDVQYCSAMQNGWTVETAHVSTACQVSVA
jgi:hypothetical protein